MSYFDELKKKYSSGSLLKKKSCKGRTIRIERLDVETANRINEKVSRSSKQYFIKSQNTMKYADEVCSD